MIAPSVRVGRAAQTMAEPAPEMLDAARKTMLSLGGGRVQRLGVTSALRGEGRTSIAVALAAIQDVDFGRRCILVDFDLESASLARRIGVQPWPGLCELVRREASLGEVIQPVSDRLSVVAAGATVGAGPRMTFELLKSGVVADLQRCTDVLIADLPPLVACSFGRAAASAFDDLLLVVRSQVTPVARVREAVAQLHTRPQIVLNGVHTRIPSWLRGLIAV